ncbi:MAG TPA: hypothetical protein VM290_01055 [Gaiellaceae bacterium]|nr:hypothetical protein [Gaiellaceae bacterium]
MTFKGTALVALVAALALIAAGCGGSGNDDEATPGTTAAETEASQTDTGMDHGAASAGVESEAVDLRIALGRLFGEHALLAQFATQKGYAGKEDFEAIANALDGNSVDIADAIGSVYGDEARTQFLDGDDMWRAHIGYFVDYTTALAKEDKAGQQKAVENLQAYVGEFSTFLAEATGAPQEAVTEAITEHVNQLKGQIDAWAANDFQTAYPLLREAYGHMFMTSDAVSGAIAEQQGLDDGGVSQGAADLRLTLGRLLGEHTILAIAATQKGYDGEMDFEQIAAALDANSVELAEAIGSVYGEEAKTTFLDGENMWRDHIRFFVEYTTALAKNDEAAQNQAVQNLQAYVGTFSAFLAEATGLPEEALTEGITEHVNQLKGQIDAYAAGDHAEAYELTRQAYHHMWETGTTLSGAIVEQDPESFSG